MKVIIAGSRSINDYNIVKDAIIMSGWYEDISEVVSGTAPGVDKLGERFADDQPSPIHIEPFPAAWNDLTTPGAIIKTNRYGKKYNAKAGFDRNQKMAEYADKLILIWDGNSRGSKDMEKRMLKLKKDVFVYNIQIEEVQI